MLEFAEVSFNYSPGRPILKNVSLKVQKGEFVAIVGRNGSGKTTLTKLAMSLLKPAEGQIIFNGVNTKKHTVADIARHIGYVFQNPDRQIFRDTVAQEVAYGPEQLGFTAVQKAQAVELALAHTGLTGLAEAYPRALSKGQKQRVAIASALAMQPEMLILDEPTSGQDAREREKLLNLLVDLNAQGMTIILITHDMDILVRYVPRVIVMAEGSKVFDGQVSELFAGGRLIDGWGLVEPVPVRISREMAKYNVPPTLQIEELCQCLAGILQGGKINAEDCTAN